MLIWKTYTKTETYAGIIKSQKTYKWLLLFWNNTVICKYRWLKEN